MYFRRITVEYAGQEIKIKNPAYSQKEVREDFKTGGIVVI